MQEKIRVHVISETEFFGKGQGVHTAFVDCVRLLRRSDALEVCSNREGWGHVMHAHTYGPYYFWKGRKYRGRRVFTVHVIPDSARGSIPAERILLPFVRWYLKRVYSYATVCICISPFVADCVRQMGVRSRIVEIGNPLDTDRFRQDPELRMGGRRHLGIESGEFVVLGVGQLERRKGVETFLDVAAMCPEATFVWVGGRPLGAMTEGIARINRRISGAPENVRWAGLMDLEQMPLAYNAADVMFFPSHQENCPLAPMEAALCGLPVVFRDLPEYRVLYQTDYPSASDTQGFATLVRRMREDAAFRAEATRQSAQLAAQFDRDRILGQLEGVYRSLID